VEKRVSGIEILYYCEKSMNLVIFFMSYGGRMTDTMTKCLNLCFYICWMYYWLIAWLVSRGNRSWHGVMALRLLFLLLWPRLPLISSTMYSLVFFIIGLSRSCCGFFILDAFDWLSYLSPIRLLFSDRFWGFSFRRMWLNTSESPLISFSRLRSLGVLIDEFEILRYRFIRSVSYIGFKFRVISL